MEASATELSEIELINFKNEYKNLPSRLEKWVKERPLFSAFSQGNARWQIAQKIKDAYYEIVDSGKIPVFPKKQVLKDTEESRKKISKILENEKDSRKSFDRTDSVTGEKYTVNFYQESSGAFVAEEVAGGMIRSQARIRTDGSTDLSLSFIGTRFDEKNDPNIDSADLFPQATTKAFNLLVDSI